MPDSADRPPLTVYWVNQFAAAPDQPGGSRHFDFARELGRRGHQVQILAGDLSFKAGGYLRRRGGWDVRFIHETIDGVRYTWLTVGAAGAHAWRRGIAMLVFAFNVLVALVRVAAPRGRTVFIGSSPQLFAALAAWCAARLRRVPFVLEVRDLWPESYTEVSGRTGGLEIWVMRRVADHLYRRSDAVIVLAEANADHIASRGGERSRIVHVPNGIDVESFIAGDPALDLARDDRFTFVYAGAHGPANDLGTVVRACHVLEQRGRNDIGVVLMGGGVAKDSLQSLAAGLGVTNLRFVDPIPRSAIGPTLRTADGGLMVLAPVELFSSGVSPNKLFDYLGAGLPVVSNVAGFVSEVIADAGVGITVAGGDPEALADAMEAMADDPPEDAATRGPAHVAEHYDRRVLAERVEELLIDL